MKKNFYYLSLLFGLVLGITMFTACGGDDDNGGGASGGASGGGAGGFTPGKFMGPKRVFGDNLLSSYGTDRHRYELTYNSDDFVSSIKSISYNSDGSVSSTKEYEASYSGNQVIVTYRNSIGEQITYTYTIGNNGFVESYVDVGDGDDEVKMEYDSEGHITKITSTPQNEPHIWNGMLTWQNGNVIKTYDSDTGSYTQNYTSINNVAGIYVRAAIGGDLDDYYDEMLYYMGLLGKGTANLVQSYTKLSSSSTGENAWTLDAAGRPTKCITTTTESGSSSPRTSTYFWTYR